MEAPLCTLCMWEEVKQISSKYQRHYFLVSISTIFWSPLKWRPENSRWWCDNSDGDEDNNTNNVNDRDSYEGDDDDDYDDTDNDNEDDNDRMITIWNKSEQPVWCWPTWSHKKWRLSLMRVIDGRDHCVKNNFY